MLFESPKNYLVCGASQGIGFALTEYILQNLEPKTVFATLRSSSDPTLLKELAMKYANLHLVVLNGKDESSYTTLADSISKHTEVLDVCINAIGILHNSKGLFPERNIDEFKIEDHLHVYQTNTLPTLLLAKSLKSLLKASDTPVFASVSAKVGSIGDNKMGGWYSYRISKTALNMAIKNLAIEFRRYNRSSLFVALHPGTTDTHLSEPFMANAKKKYTIHSPAETAKNLIHVLQKLRPGKDTGLFLSWDGTTIEW